MQVVELRPPTNGGVLFDGLAVSTRGRRYTFAASVRGKAIAVFREDERYRLTDGRTFWSQVTAPKALASAVRRAVAKANLIGRRPCPGCAPQPQSGAQASRYVTVSR